MKESFLGEFSFLLTIRKFVLSCGLKSLWPGKEEKNSGSHC
jgi:hypothetical protein